MKLYKFRSMSPFEYVADILVNERLYCPTYPKLNDPFEGTFVSLVLPQLDENGAATKPHYKVDRVGTDTALKGLEEIRVYSLCKHMHDVRMWSHYADSHRGIAIEIDFDGFEFPVREVTYHPTLPEVVEPRDPKLKLALLLQALTRKTDHWEYEDEYRILGSNEYLHVQGRITAVLFGKLFDRDKEKIIERLLPDDVKLLKAYLDPVNLKIVSVPYTPSDET